MIGSGKMYLHLSADACAAFIAAFQQTASRVQLVEPDRCADPQSIDYVFVGSPLDEIHNRFPNAKIVFSLGAGVDVLDTSEWPADLHLVRMIEPGISAKISEYVSMSVLMLHRDMLRYRHQQSLSEWKAHPIVNAGDRPIGIMGLGVLGRAAADALLNFGFPISGWSRTEQTMDGVTTYSGASGLTPFLRSIDILVCMLPLTQATAGILNAELFAQLPQGASLVHVGRGGHLVDDALIDALDSGQLSGAIIDVTSPEPLPAQHAFWDHPQILLTPHVASRTDLASAARFVARSISQFGAGTKMEGLVDRKRGY